MNLKRGTDPVALCKEVSGWRDEEGRKDAPLP